MEPSGSVSPNRSSSDSEFFETINRNTDKARSVLANVSLCLIHGADNLPSNLDITQKEETIELCYEVLLELFDRGENTSILASLYETIVTIQESEPNRVSISVKIDQCKTTQTLKTSLAILQENIINNILFNPGIYPNEALETVLQHVGTSRHEINFDMKHNVTLSAFLNEKVLDVRTITMCIEMLIRDNYLNDYINNAKETLCNLSVHAKGDSRASLVFVAFCPDNEISVELKIAAAKYLFAHVDKFSDEVIVRISAMLMRDPENSLKSVIESAKIILSNFEKHDLELIYGYLVFFIHCLNENTELEFKVIATNLVWDSMKNFEKHFIEEFLENVFDSFDVKLPLDENNSVNDNQKEIDKTDKIKRNMMILNKLGLIGKINTTHCKVPEPIHGYCTYIVRHVEHFRKEFVELAVNAIAKNKKNFSNRDVAYAAWVIVEQHMDFFKASMLDAEDFVNFYKNIGKYSTALSYSQGLNAAICSANERNNNRVSLWYANEFLTVLFKNPTLADFILDSRTNPTPRLWIPKFLRPLIPIEINHNTDVKKVQVTKVKCPEQWTLS